MNVKNCLLSVVFLCIGNAAYADKTPIRLGTMAAGTLNWELAAMRDQGLLEKAGFSLEAVAIANQQAGKVALQAGAVDVIVSDWIWTSAMRAEGHAYSFYPYADTSGVLLVPADSPIKTLTDLPGKKLGVAGGELDKNWLLLQALGKQQQLDLNASVEKVYAAPPLLGQQLQSKRLDALLTYWQFAAHLESLGYRALLSGEDIIAKLGITETVPSLGYVFKQDWADSHKTDFLQFLTLSRQARDTLCSSDAAWQKILPLTDAATPTEQDRLRQRYCQGRVEAWGAPQQDAARAIFTLLHGLSGNKLTGGADRLQAGTFWSTD
ncbi:ABC transporter substrate-binding protein [Methylomonas sp. MED-D]|uniref:ABC transporter substrate-binding protein n=1 Tax=unclassified Methylomonas TaxID=2608980 RepID=UPI0028A37E8D|nr:transporter substrate-binding domain-containing protein [Methylomonas sp. MV1]MDT4331994.1 transporter substrate-binding domain-containing protein [Methylomonas sp. MV1]